MSVTVDRPDTPTTGDAREGVLEICRRAREASRPLATASPAAKDRALHAIADTRAGSSRSRSARWSAARPGRTG
jgi:glutamate-5-semialdehyde dehydrogenase